MSSPLHGRAAVHSMTAKRKQFLDLEITSTNSVISRDEGKHQVDTELLLSHWDLF